MSVPKQRHSKARQARGRVHYVKSIKNDVLCLKCGASILAHRVCPKCGFYKDREYVNTMKQVETPAKKEKK